MAIIKPVQRDSISPSLLPLSPYNLYLERVKSVSERLRSVSAGYDYLPLQFGGLTGQQESLLANAVVTIIDFKVNGS